MNSKNLNNSPIFGGSQNILADTRPVPFICVGRTSHPLSGIFVDNPEYKLSELSANNSAGEMQPVKGLNSIILGSNCTTNFNNTILLGDGLIATQDNQLVIGSAKGSVSVSLTKDEHHQLYSLILGLIHK